MTLKMRNVPVINATMRGELNTNDYHTSPRQYYITASRGISGDV
jgi:hypothetical protein